jgi:hypothetical protein
MDNVIPPVANANATSLGMESTVQSKFVLKIVITMDYAKKENVFVMMDSKETSVRNQYAKIIAIIKESVIKANAIV